jgi:hypothetical protein
VSETITGPKGAQETKVERTKGKQHPGSKKNEGAEGGGENEKKGCSEEVNALQKVKRGPDVCSTEGQTDGW